MSEVKKEQGATGTDIQSGFFNEEYLTKLQGQEGAVEFDKMRRNDTQIKMVLSMFKNPIKSALWNVQPASDDESDIKYAEFVEWQLFHDLKKTWREYLHEFLSFLDFGYSIFEKVWKKDNNPKWGDFIGLEKLAMRMQKTIYRWNFKDGELFEVEQQVYNDEAREIIRMPVDDLMIFTNEREGNNYEGISILRPAYGAWWRKNIFLKLMAIGIERNAIPLPHGEIPKGRENDEDAKTNFKRALEKYLQHQKGYIMTPEGWKITFHDGKFDASRVKQAIIYEDTAMTKATLASFMELGMDGKGGSYALGADRSDFFLSAIQYVADYIAEKFNNEIIPILIDVNFGPGHEYPKLTVADISDKAGIELANTLGTLVEKGVLLPDVAIEDMLRERYKLPARAELSPEVNASPASPQPKSDDSVRDEISDKQDKQQLYEFQENGRMTAAQAKSISKDFDMEEDKLARMMKNRLSLIAEKGLADLQRGLRAETNKLNAVDRVTLNPASYRKDLLLATNKITNTGRKQGEKSLKGMKKLAEGDDLPPKIRKKNKLASKQTADSQVLDLESVIRFSALSAIERDLSDQAIMFEAEQAAEKFVKSGKVDNAAKTIAATAINAGRQVAFDQNVDRIQGFEFSAVIDDVTTDICQSLNGKTFKVNDPESFRWRPPLHHNCRSILVPIPATETDVTFTGLKPSASAQKQATLATTTLNEGENHGCGCKH